MITVGFEIPKEPKLCPIKTEEKICGHKMKRNGSVMICTDNPAHKIQLKTKKVEIEENHIFICGKTRAGKSKLMEALIDRSNMRFLIIDAKKKRDYQSFDADIPLYIEELMDPLSVKNLIESTKGMSMSGQFAELGRLVEFSNNWEELIENAKEKQEQNKIHPVVKDRLKVIELLLIDLVSEMNMHDFVDSVELPQKINVMNISMLSAGLQQVVVSSTINYIHEHEENIVIVIDEASRFVPQSSSSACLNDIVRLIKEGAASKRWLWLSDQTITGVNKDVLKQMEIWILGKQRELNEAKRTVNQIPFSKSMGIRAEDIQTLRVGQFLVVGELWSKKVYAQPLWIDEDLAKQVALGEVDVKTVRDLEHKKTQDSEEEMWKEKYEELQSKLKAERKQCNAEIEELEQKLEDLKTREDKTSELRQEIADLKEKLNKKNMNLETFAEFKKLIQKVFMPELPDFESLKQEIEIPEGIQVNTEQPQLTVVKTLKPITVTEGDLIGKIAILYAKGKLGTDWVSSGTVDELLNQHGWNYTPVSIRANLDDMTQWGFLEKRKAGRRNEWRVIMTPAEAKKKGLLKFTEEITE